MAGSANPGYNSNMQRFPVPEKDVDAQPFPNMDWGAPIPGDLNPLADALIGESVPSGDAFTRVVSPSGQADVLDPGV